MTTTSTQPPPSTIPSQRSRKAVTAIFGVLLLLATAGLGALGYSGYKASRNLTGGTKAKKVTDPSAPGFVATLRQSSVHLLLILDDGDQLSALMMVAPSEAADGTGGTFVWTPGEMFVSADPGAVSFADAYKSLGAQGVKVAFETLIGYAMTDVTAIGTTEFEALGGSTPIALTNPDAVAVVEKGRRVIKFKSGDITIPSNKVAEFLTTNSAGEVVENRATRTTVFFEAFSKSLAAAIPPVTDPVVAVIGKYLAKMGGGSIDSTTLPFIRTKTKSESIYRPDVEKIASELVGIVRFPRSAFPGQRPRVRVLNGTTDLNQAADFAPAAAKAGGEVVIIGNGETTDVTTSTVTYTTDQFAPVAQRIAEALNVTATKSEVVSDSADIEVILGTNVPS